MGSARHAPPMFAALLATVSVVGAVSCGESPAPGHSPGAGVVVVRGSERLLWNQVGDVSVLRFRAYVDDRGVSLAGAACDGPGPEFTCASPLPPLTDGVHTIALTAIDAFSGLESARSASVTVQKIAGAAVSPGALHLSSASRETLIPVSDGLALVADVVATGLEAPAQVAAAPDGRLFVAEASGRVLAVDPDEPDRTERALDTRTFLDSSLASSLGLALHPAFAKNHFVYIAFHARTRAGEPVLRVVRLREAGSRLGEPATLFEARLEATAPDRGGPRMAFGPDGLLYLALPPGVEFDNEPAASGPVAAMLRLSGEGRVPDGIPPLTGMVAHPLGFGWHPLTSALWVIFPRQAGEAVLRPLAVDRKSGVDERQRVMLQMTEDAARRSRSLLFQAAQPGALDLAQAFAAGLERDSLRPVRLSAPVLAEGAFAGWLGRVGDVAVADGGTLFLTSSSTEETLTAGGGSAGDTLIVRLVRRRR